MHVSKKKIYFAIGDKNNYFSAIPVHHFFSPDYKVLAQESSSRYNFHEISTASELWRSTYIQLKSNLGTEGEM